MGGFIKEWRYDLGLGSGLFRQKTMQEVFFMGKQNKETMV